MATNSTGSVDQYVAILKPYKATPDRVYRYALGLVHGIAMNTIGSDEADRLIRIGNVAKAVTAVLYGETF